jgi:hypothetical protein
MNVADLAAGDFTIGVDGGTHRDECCVVVLFVVAVATGQGLPGGDKRGDGEAGGEMGIGQLVKLTVRDRIARHRWSRPLAARVAGR